MTDLPYTRLSPAAAAAERILSMDTQELRAELARALTITSETLQYLAAIWRELERRGEDLSDLRSGIGGYLPMIASGHVAAEAVVAFAGRRGALKAVSTLPLSRQLALASGERVAIVERDPQGKLVEKEIPVSALSTAQVARVFDEGRIRLPVEQRRRLLEQPETLSPKSRKIGLPRGQQPSVVVQGDYVVVGRQAVRRDHLIEALKRLKVIQ